MEDAGWEENGKHKREKVSKKVRLFEFKEICRRE